MVGLENKCNCGRPVRYIQMKGDVEVMSCNKHIACPTYDELVKTNQELTRELLKKTALLDKIKSVLVELGVQNVKD